MPKIKFENGVVVNVEGNPTQADIEEIASQLGVKSTETPGGVSGAFKRGWSGLKEDLNKRVDNTGQAMNANQSGASKALQVAGQGFGTIGDVIGAGVMTAASALTPDDAEQAIKTKFTEGVKKIMETNTAKSTMDKYSKFKEENPELAGNIEAIGNISDAFLNAVGVGAAEKGVETAGKSVFKAGVKGVGELASAGEKSVDFTKKIADMGKRFGQGAKEKFAESKLGEKVADVISPMDNNVKKTIDPLASVPAENIPNIPKEVIEKAKEATSGRLEYYLNKARRATQNPSLPTPLEFAGKKAEEALNTIGKKISKYSQLKKSETEAFKETVIQGLPEIKTKLIDSIGEIAGVDLNVEPAIISKNPIQEELTQVYHDPKKRRLETKGGYLEYSIDKDSNEFIIDYVEATEKRKGIGTKLMNAAEKIAEKDGLDVGLVASPQDNVQKFEDLKDFYESLGYENVAEFGDVAEFSKKNADLLFGEVPTKSQKTNPFIQPKKQVIQEDGEFVAKAGRSIAVSDPKDLRLIKTIKSKLDSLGDTPTFKQVDDAVDYLQDLLYKKKANLAEPINSRIEGVVKKITGELNGKLRASGSKLYRESNQSISRMMDVREKLNKALGRDANKGGSLMKRVFSPTDGGTKELFKEIKRITGIDLNEEATLAKFAMEQLGDARQANLLEQLELIKGAVGARGSFLKNIAEKAGKAAVGDQVERARRILKK